MWQKLKDDWRYHPEQRKGLWVLVLFVALAFSYLWITNQFVQPPPTSYFPALDSAKGPVLQTFYFDPNRITAGQLDSLGIPMGLAKRWLNYRNAGGQFREAQDLERLWGMDSATYHRIAPYALFPNTPKESQVRPELRPFDPNTADSASWLTLGIKPYQIKSIRRFIRKGGRFNRPEDLRKMWVLDSVVVRELMPYVAIDSISAEPEKQRVIRVNINRADSATLVSIKGLGGVYARRILQHRRKLRGFVNLNQLLEVYGVDSARFEAWKPYFECNPSEVKKLDINRATVDELGRHPYIGYKLAKEWVDFRTHVRPFRNLEELRQLGLMDADKLAKIAPYLVAGSN